MEVVLFVVASLIVTQCVLQTLSQAAPVDDGASDEIHTHACYGTHMNFLEASCPQGEVIKVSQVFYGAKLKSTECPNLTHQNYRPECCTADHNDCMISLILENKPDPYFKTCDNKPDCSMNSRWLDTSSKCDQKLYLPRTNYMAMVYTCVKDPNVTKAQTRPRMLTWSTNWRKQTFRPSRKTTKKTTTLKPTTKQLTSTTSQSPTTVHRSTTHSPRKLEVRTSKEPIPIKPALWNETVNAAASRPEPTSKVNVTVSYKPKKHTAKKNLPPDFAFTTGMIGGMVAAIIGLMLTIFGFVFYWGRRRRKAVTMKPNSSTVWDFLLSHTVASRTFRRGYDNFGSNSNCSSVSSEGDLQSPTARKTTWLPNITVDSGNFDTNSVTSDDNISRVNVPIPGPRENRSADNM